MLQVLWGSRGFQQSKTPIEWTFELLMITTEESFCDADFYPMGGSNLPSSHIPLAARDREKSFVGYFGAGMGSSGTVNRPGRAQDTSQVRACRDLFHYIRSAKF
uniref:Uncharacterized protein n=1 Tax=Parascaris equorum TaxID=6256 RepID=A0A914RT72_PAREQ